MTPQQIASYLDDGLSSEERRSFEQHLFECPECRADLALATEVRGGRRGQPRLWKRAAAAAGIAALLAIGVMRLAEPTPSPLLPSGGDDTRIVIVAPASDGTADPDSLTFAWRPVGTESHYEFVLTAANGDVVFTSGQSDTTLVLPGSVVLEPGALYFWYVDALLDGARSVSTGAHEFTVTR